MIDILNTIILNVYSGLYGNFTPFYTLSKTAKNYSVTRISKISSL